MAKASSFAGHAELRLSETPIRDLRGRMLLARMPTMLHATEKNEHFGTKSCETIEPVIER